MCRPKDCIRWGSVLLLGTLAIVPPQEARQVDLILAGWLTACWLEEALAWWLVEGEKYSQLDTDLRTVDSLYYWERGRKFWSVSHGGSADDLTSPRGVDPDLFQLRGRIPTPPRCYGLRYQRQVVSTLRYKRQVVSFHN